jgi:hypothetical protein
LNVGQLKAKQQLGFQHDFPTARKRKQHRISKWRGDKCAEKLGREQSCFYNELSALSRWLGREGSNLQMAESKSAEFLNNIKEISELSLSVRPLTILENFLRSE